MSTEASERRSNIEAAFRRLPIKKDAERLVPSMVDLLDRMPSSLVPKPSFETSAKTATIKELDALERHASALADCLELLRGPAIDALAASGFIRQSALQGQLHQLAESARKAKESNVPDNETRGRRDGRLQSTVAEILAGNFRSLTGSRPTIRTHAGNKAEGVAYGPFLELVRDVFGAMGITSNPEVYAKPAVAKLRKALDGMEEISAAKG